MSRERVTADELLEAAKAARNLKHEHDLRTGLAEEEALERGVSFNALVAEEAMALGERMLELDRPLNLRRLIGRQAIGVEREGRTLHAYYARNLITPTLFRVQEEFDGEVLAHGWRFRTRANRENKLRPWKVISVGIVDRTEVLDPEIEAAGLAPDPIEKEELIRLQVARRDGKIVSVPFFYTRKDLNDPELLNMYALLNMARHELGDKKTK